MSELKFLSFSLILYVREIQILAVQIDSICKGLAFPLSIAKITSFTQLLPKRSSTHHCAVSKDRFCKPSAMEWCHRFFKTLFQCFESNVPLDESFYM